MSFEYNEPTDTGTDTEATTEPTGVLGGGSLMDQLAAEIAKPMASETVRVKVPLRDQFVVSFDSRLSWEDRQSISERSTKSDGSIDVMKLSVLLLANQCTGIELRGEKLTEDGKAVTFRSRSFLDSTGALDQVEALRKFFADDADLMNAGTIISLATGYENSDRQAAMVDPTGQ